MISDLKGMLAGMEPAPHDGVWVYVVCQGAMAAVGISCNVVAGAYHDHLFVAEADAGRAMGALRALQVAHV